MQANVVLFLHAILAISPLEHCVMMLILDQVRLLRHSHIFGYSFCGGLG